MAEISRRRLAMLAGAALSVAQGGAAVAQAAAQGAAVQGDHLQRQRESITEALAELKRFELEYGDEPMFRVVIR